MKNGIFIVSLLALALPLAAAEVETVIKGQRMELLQQGDIVVFSGGVRLERGTDVILADEMRTNKGRTNVTAIGNVRMSRKVSLAEDWKGTGDRGFYDTNTGEGNLLGGKKQAHMIRTEVVSSTQSRRMDVYADRFDFKRNEKEVAGTGKVYGTSMDKEVDRLYEFWSTAAFYDGADKVLKLDGLPQPKVATKEPEGRRTIKGDVIHYYVEARRFISEGNAQAVFIDEGKQTP